MKYQNIIADLNYEPHPLFLPYFLSHQFKFNLAKMAGNRQGFQNNPELHEVRTTGIDSWVWALMEELEVNGVVCAGKLLHKTPEARQHKRRQHHAQVLVGVSGNQQNCCRHVDIRRKPIDSRASTVIVPCHPQPCKLS